MVTAASIPTPMPPFSMPLPPMSLTPLPIIPITPMITLKAVINYICSSFDIEASMSFTEFFCSAKVLELSIFLPSFPSVISVCLLYFDLYHPFSSSLLYLSPFNLLSSTPYISLHSLPLPLLPLPSAPDPLPFYFMISPFSLSLYSCSSLN